VDEERNNLRQRIEILRAYVKAIENPEELLRVCARVEGGIEDVRSAVARAFDVSDVAADAILSMQVRRFTPHAIQQLRDQLADDERRLLELGQA